MSRSLLQTTSDRVENFGNEMANGDSYKECRNVLFRFKTEVADGEPGFFWIRNIFDAGKHHFSSDEVAQLSPESLLPVLESCLNESLQEPNRPGGDNFHPSGLAVHFIKMTDLERYRNTPIYGDIPKILVEEGIATGDPLKVLGSYIVNFGPPDFTDHKYGMLGLTKFDRPNHQEESTSGVIDSGVIDYNFASNPLTITYLNRTKKVRTTVSCPRGLRNDPNLSVRVHVMDLNDGTMTMTGLF